MESIPILNERLLNNFGKFENMPRFRLAWSDDQVEKRISSYTPEGLQLLHDQVVELPKYAWIRNRWILEMYVVVPESNRHELTTKMSYEPIWVFEDRYHNPLPPKWEAIFLIATTVLDNLQRRKPREYKDPLAGMSEQDRHEKHREEIIKIEQELFGNETEVGDALAHHQAIIVPRGFEVKK